MVWQGTVDIFRKYERYNSKVHLLNPFYQSFSFVFTLLFVCLVVWFFLNVISNYTSLFLYIIYNTFLHLSIKLGDNSLNMIVTNRSFYIITRLSAKTILRFFKLPSPIARIKFKLGYLANTFKRSWESSWALTWMTERAGLVWVTG